MVPDLVKAIADRTSSQNWYLKVCTTSEAECSDVPRARVVDPVGECKILIEHLRIPSRLWFESLLPPASFDRCYWFGKSERVGQFCNIKNSHLSMLCNPVVWWAKSSHMWRICSGLAPKKIDRKKIWALLTFCWRWEGFCLRLTSVLCASTWLYTTDRSRAPFAGSACACLWSSCQIWCAVGVVVSLDSERAFWVQARKVYVPVDIPKLWHRI